MLLIGIDQSTKEHTVCIMDATGCQLAQLTIPHAAAGFQQLHAYCQTLPVSPGECFVALESKHCLLVDYLLDQGYQVYVIPGKAVDRYRDRHRQSRSCSDGGDATVLAHIMRTDRHLHTRWEADTPLTRQIRSQVTLLLGIKQAIVRHTNQLRALLWRYYPVAADLFSCLDTYIALAFIQAYPTPQVAKSLTADNFAAFCRATPTTVTISQSNRGLPVSAHQVTSVRKIASLHTVGTSVIRWIILESLEVCLFHFITRH